MLCILDCIISCLGIHCLELIQFLVYRQDTGVLLYFQQPDLLDYIDLVPSSAGYSDLDTALSGHAQNFDTLCESRLQEANSLFQANQQNHTLTDPESDTSPIWYPPSNKTKPNMETPSPEKMLPHRLF